MISESIAASKILDDIWKQKQNNADIGNVRKVKSSMNRRDFAPQLFHRNKTKQENRGNREKSNSNNRRLLSRISNIISAKSNINNKKLLTIGFNKSSKSPRYQSIERKFHIRKQSSEASNSMRIGIRRREDLRIAHENLQLLKRLQDQTSVYNCYGWKKEEVHRKKLLKNISNFQPSILFHPHKRKTKSNSKSGRSTSPLNSRRDSSQKDNTQKLNCSNALPKLAKHLRIRYN